MKRANIEQWIVVFLLIASTVWLRLQFQHIPNFAPVANRLSFLFGN